MEMEPTPERTEAGPEPPPRAREGGLVKPRHPTPRQARTAERRSLRNREPMLLDG
jgi:hypothetical protein